MDRRTIPKGGLVLAATSHAAVVAPEMPKAPPSVDEFLKIATPAEVVRYHTNSLMEAMSAMRPDMYWAAFSDIDLSQVQIVGRDRA